MVRRVEYDPTSFIFKCDLFPSINSGGMRKQPESEELDQRVGKQPQQWGVMGNNVVAKMDQLACQFMS